MVNENFSSELRNLKNLSDTLTHNKKLQIQYNDKAKTSSWNWKNEIITLTLNAYPQFVKDNAVLAVKILDADLAHEDGHDIKTKPFIAYYEGFFKKCAGNPPVYLYKQLAHDVMNLIEDKRVNYYIEMRYKHDVGLRLKFADKILGDATDHFWNTEGKEKLFGINSADNNKPSILQLINGVLCGKGLYSAKMETVFEYLAKQRNGAEILADVKQLLNLLENSRFQSLRIDLMRTANDMYIILKKYVKASDQNSTNKFMHVRNNGQLETKETSATMKEKLKAMVKTEEEKNAQQKEKAKLQADLEKLGTVGEGKGTELTAPECNIPEYYRLVTENSEYINALLKKLKQTLRPIVKREFYQKRGHIINGLMAKAYANSFKRNVQRICFNSNVEYEKEKVNIAFLFDISGSVDLTLAKNICTVLSETFGKWLNDYSYSLSVFADGCFKIKTFFEAYENTKGRIGNLDYLGRGDTCILELLKSYIKQFNAIRDERRKILVICSDFYFSSGEENDTIEALRLCEKLKIELLFLSFGSVKAEFINRFPKAKSQYVNDIAELPKLFIDIYLNTQTKTERS